ncbi:hypothetical protein FJZ23_00045 [Candidatus Parcubacteria bacterium]|nr:hypothetical protein [Candidatus Parcubacteria bacterium]
MLHYFYGQECPHCHAMMPLVDKLIEEGLPLKKYETWHDKKNAELLEEKDKGACGAVPFFYNDETGKTICGAASEEEVRTWAGT